MSNKNPFKNPFELSAVMLNAEIVNAQRGMKYAIHDLRQMLDEYEKNPHGPFTPSNMTKLAAVIETSQVRFASAHYALKLNEAVDAQMSAPPPKSVVPNQPKKKKRG